MSFLPHFLPPTLSSMYLLVTQIHVDQSSPCGPKIICQGWVRCLCRVTLRRIITTRAILDSNFYCFSWATLVLTKLPFRGSWWGRQPAEQTHTARIIIVASIRPRTRLYAVTDLAGLSRLTPARWNWLRDNSAGAFHILAKEHFYSAPGSPPRSSRGGWDTSAMAEWGVC